MKKKLFEIKDIDRKVYQEELASFLPENMIDIHTHVWLKKFKFQDPEAVKRTVSWPALVAEESPVEELLETYQLLFPGKKVTPMIFSSISRSDDIPAMNNYIAESARKNNLPSLLFALPEWGADELYEKIVAGGHFGTKVYLNLSPAYLPVAEIRIFDFIPHHQLELLNRHHMILMLHIPRNDRLRDPVNLAQMLEIEELYPNIHVIYAHIGRAYCPEDFGNAFELLSKTKRLVIDFSANTNAEAMLKALESVGPERLLFGSDLPILRMRMKRICENGRYINIVPKGMYGDVSNDTNMREIAGSEAEELTFFMYEELRSFKKAAMEYGLNNTELEQVFYGNAKGIIEDVKGRLGY